MSNNENTTTNEQNKENLIYKTGWLTVLPIGIWYMFNFLFNVGALYFYGINSGYNSMKIEIDFFSLIVTGCLFLVYFVFLYNILQERLRLYKILIASSIFFITMTLLLYNLIIGTVSGIVFVMVFLFFIKKEKLANLPSYTKNIIILTSFVSVVILSFSSGYFYSKRFADYYCIEDTITDRFSKVLVARTDEGSGVFVESDNITHNSFNKKNYEIIKLEKIKLSKCIN